LVKNKIKAHLLKDYGADSEVILATCMGNTRLSLAELHFNTCDDYVSSKFTFAQGFDDEPESNVTYSNRQT